MTPQAGAPNDVGGVDVRRILRSVALFAVVAVIALVALATLPGVSEVRERFASAQLGWMAVVAACSLASMIGFSAALCGAFDRTIPFRNALELGFAEQGANVLLPAGGAGGPALGTFVMSRAGVPTNFATERHAALFLVTSGVSFVGLLVAGLSVGIGLLPGDAAAGATLLPAGLAVLVIVVGVVFSRTDVPPEPAGGRLRHGFWRVRRFLR